MSDKVGRDCAAPRGRGALAEAFGRFRNRLILIHFLLALSILLFLTGSTLLAVVALPFSLLFAINYYRLWRAWGSGGYPVLALAAMTAAVAVLSALFGVFVLPLVMSLL